MPASLRPWSLRLTFLAIVCALFAWWLRHDPHLSWYNDNAAYLVLGEALATGQGYGFAHGLAFEPAGKWPAGYPALIAVVARLLPHRHLIELVEPLQLINGLLFCFGIWLAWRWVLEKTRDPWLAVAAAWLLALHPWALALADDVMSEIPYLVVSVATMVAAERWLKNSRPSWHHMVWLACMTAAGIWLRSLGLAAAAGIALWLIRRRAWKALAGFLCLTGALTAPWWYWSLSAPGLSYVEELFVLAPDTPEGLRVISPLAFLGRLAHHAALYAESVALQPLNLLEHAPSAALRAVVGDALLLWGFLAVRRRANGPTESMVAVYLMLTLAWWFADMRLLIPLLPFLLGYWCVGLGQFLHRITGRRAEAARWGMVATASLALITTLPVHARFMRIKAMPWEAAPEARHPDRYADYLNAIWWIDRHTHAADVVMCIKPYFMYAYTGRRSLPLALDRFETLPGRLAPDTTLYIVEDRLTGPHQDRLISPHIPRLAAAGRIRPVARFGDPATVIWIRSPEAESVAPTTAR